MIGNFLMHGGEHVKSSNMLVLLLMMMIVVVVVVVVVLMVVMSCKKVRYIHTLPDSILQYYVQCLEHISSCKL
jgi:flagellar basal body-associated protein FliL